MGISNLLSHRQLIYRRIGQFLLVLLALVVALALTQLPVPPKVRFILSCVVIVGAVLKLLSWERRATLRAYGLTILPPGWGTLRPTSMEGAGRFLSLVELASRFKWKAGGLLMGCPLPEHQIFGLFSHLWVGPVDDRHLLTIAGARAGKATAALIPNLLLYPGSALVIDPKGELAQITAARRGAGSERVTESLGQDVFVLDPEDIVVNLPRASWNPLAELDLADPHLWGKVARVALALVPIPEKEDPFFATQARDLLTAFILHTLTTEPPERHNLIYVRRLISQGDRELFQLIVDECQQAGTQVPFTDALEATLDYIAGNLTQGGKVSGIAQRLLGMADDTRSGILATLSEQTSFLDHYSMEKTLQQSDFSLADLKKRPTTIYVCMKGTSLAGPLSKLMYVLIDLAITAMEDVPGKPPYNVLFAMDEFYCLGRNETLDRAMGLMAGFGLTLWPVLQHIGQLKRYYPDTWDNFVRNCRAVQYFGDLDPETLQSIEKRVGDRVFFRQDGSVERRPMLTANELSSSYFTREARRQLVCFQQQPASLLKLLDYYIYFPHHWYEDDPRANDRSQYAAWSG